MVPRARYITLYDALEQDTYELICDYALLIGVHLDKDAPDYALANEIRDHIIEMLEKEFNISFPVYGEEKPNLDSKIEEAVKKCENVTTANKTKGTDIEK